MTFTKGENEMKHEKMFKNDLARVETPAIEKILPASDAKQTKRAPRAKKKVGVVAMSVILCCVMVLGVAAATTAPLIRKILNDKRVTENTQQLTVVPEGYVGIYTKEDLLAIGKRGGPDGVPTKFILMSDITFTDEDYAAGGICEGGIRPIEIIMYATVGGKEVISSSSLSEFNGNGYVIRNLKLIPDEENQKVGLFGDVVTVINLGVENCEIKVIKDSITNRRFFVGAISATASFVGACYVDGLEIDISYAWKESEVQGVRYEILIGGICGQANLMDSCFVNNAEIGLNGVGVGESSKDTMTLSMGGVAGFSNACITSWFSGNIENKLEGKLSASDVGNIISNDLSDDFPFLMDSETFDTVSQKVMNACGGKDAFEYKKFCAYYLKKDMDAVHSEHGLEELMITLNQINNMTGGKMDLENQRVWYIFDTMATFGEKGGIYEILLKAYDGDKEAVKQLCEYAYLTYGETYCYTLDMSKPLSSADLEGFDFDMVWTFRDGKPVQQVFVH